MTFYHPTDGYLYGWRWSNGDEAWWSTVDLALRYTHDITGQPGEPIRRRYVVGEVEAWTAGGRCGDVLEEQPGRLRLASVLADAGLLADGPPPETPNRRTT